MLCLSLGLKSSCFHNTLMDAFMTVKDLVVVETYQSPIFPNHHDVLKSFSEPTVGQEVDFYKFLEGARRNAIQDKHEVQTTEKEVSSEQAIDVMYKPQSIAKPVISDEYDKKSKNKSWKQILFFWNSYSNKKKKKMSSQVEPISTVESKTAAYARCLKSKPASSPNLRNNTSRIGSGGLLRHVSSGPLSGCFTPKLAENATMPYILLEQNRKQDKEYAFGPIYKVT